MLDLEFFFFRLTEHRRADVWTRVKVLTGTGGCTQSRVRRVSVPFPPAKLPGEEYTTVNLTGVVTGCHMQPRRMYLTVQGGDNFKKRERHFFPRTLFFVLFTLFFIFHSC